MFKILTRDDIIGVEFPVRRRAKNLGQQEGRVKGGFPGYKVKRGSATAGQNNSGARKEGHGGLNQHNSPLSYDLQPKRGRNV